MEDNEVKTKVMSLQKIALANELKKTTTNVDRLEYLKTNCKLTKETREEICKYVNLYREVLKTINDAIKEETMSNKPSTRFNEVGVIPKKDIKNVRLNKSKEEGKRKLIRNKYVTRKDIVEEAIPSSVISESDEQTLENDSSPLPIKAVISSTLCYNPSYFNNFISITSQNNMAEKPEVNKDLPTVPNQLNIMKLNTEPIASEHVFPKRCSLSQSIINNNVSKSSYLCLCVYKSEYNFKKSEQYNTQLTRNSDSYIFKGNEIKELEEAMSILNKGNKANIPYSLADMFTKQMIKLKTINSVLSEKSEMLSYKSKELIGTPNKTKTVLLNSSVIAYPIQRCECKDNDKCSTTASSASVKAPDVCNMQLGGSDEKLNVDIVCQPSHFDIQTIQEKTTIALNNLCAGLKMWCGMDEKEDDDYIESDTSCSCKYPFAPSINSLPMSMPICNIMEWDRHELLKFPSDHQDDGGSRSGICSMYNWTCNPNCNNKRIKSSNQTTGIVRKYVGGICTKLLGQNPTRHKKKADRETVDEKIQCQSQDKTDTCGTEVNMEDCGPHVPKKHCRNKLGADSDLPRQSCPIRHSEASGTKYENTSRKWNLLKHQNKEKFGNMDKSRKKQCEMDAFNVISTIPPMKPIPSSWNLKNYESKKDYRIISDKRNQLNESDTSCEVAIEPAVEPTWDLKSYLSNEDYSISSGSGALRPIKQIYGCLKYEKVPDDSNTQKGKLSSNLSTIDTMNADNCDLAEFQACGSNGPFWSFAKAQTSKE